MIDHAYMMKLPLKNPRYIVRRTSGLVIHSPPTVLLIQVFNSFSLGAFAQRANPEFLGRAFLMGCHNCRIAGKKEFPQYMIFVF